MDDRDDFLGMTEEQREALGRLAEDLGMISQDVGEAVFMLRQGFINAMLEVKPFLVVMAKAMEEFNDLYPGFGGEGRAVGKRRHNYRKRRGKVREGKWGRGIRRRV